MREKEAIERVCVTESQKARPEPTTFLFVCSNLAVENLPTLMVRFYYKSFSKLVLEAAELTSLQTATE